MICVTFVCLGNICRSPMAEAVFKKMTDERGISSSFDIKSYGTSDWEEGNSVYPPAQETLQRHGIVGFKHRSQPLTLSAVINSDYVLVMDNNNLLDVVRMTAGGYGDKIFKLGHFLTPQIDVADPYYTRDFERAYNEIYAGCEAFLKYIENRHSDGLNYDKIH